MSSESTSALLSARFEKLKQGRGNLAAAAAIYTPEPLPLLIKPPTSTWEDLEKKLEKVVNLAGLMKTVRELYNEGYGAELETAAEVALATAKKSPFNLFAAMVSKKSGNWATKTLKMVQETWEVRRNAVQVIEKLKLKAESTKAILAIAWRLKGTIIRFLGIATEQGCGIKNPIGLFFALTKKQPSAA